MLDTEYFIYVKYESILPNNIFVLNNLD